MGVSGIIPAVCIAHGGVSAVKDRIPRIGISRIRRDDRIRKRQNLGDNRYYEEDGHETCRELTVDSHRRLSVKALFKVWER